MVSSSLPSKSLKLAQWIKRAEPKNNQSGTCTMSMANLFHVHYLKVHMQVKCLHKPKQVNCNSPKLLDSGLTKWSNQKVDIYKSWGQGNEIPQSIFILNTHFVSESSF